MEFTDPDALSSRLSIHGFGDVNIIMQRNRIEGEDEENESRFELGSFDLYLVSHLAENISFLGEIVFEGDGINRPVDGSDEESKVELERLTITYRASDLLFVSLGRHHTPLGFWNEAYHHGRLLQPSVERPEVMQWEDMGGILPVHSVGVNIGGRWFGRSWGLDYEAAIWNGRGAESDEVQAFADLDNTKATTLRLTFSREKKSRLLLGTMIDLDTIPEDPLVPGRESEIKERILGGHLVFRNDRFEWISEIYRVVHEIAGGDADFEHTGYFGIGVYRAHKLKPYAGYDRLNLDEQDPYFQTASSSLKRILAGLRWDLHPASAIKFEYNRDERPGVRFDAIIVQAGFTF